MITEQSMDSSGSTTDHSSNLSCSPTPPKSALTPPSLGGQSSSPGAGAGGSGRISQNSPPLLSSGGPGPHQLSPPHVSTPPSSSLAAAARLSAHHSMPSLPPSLGLLNSLSNMVHHSPLDLMSSVSHHHPHMPPRSYNSPPPISTSDPTANECKLVDYRGHKVAAFIIAGDTMLCLPQAFELFLKHLVGGLHTVYTKLKRLDIVPLVCNVEQVRILRGLGAIQPGVNRCKLLSCKDFDILYRDCTTARCMMSHKATDGSRPGRPPKRTSSVGLSIAASHLSQLKKHRENGDYGYENGHLSSVDGSRLEKSPLLANGYNHPPTHLNHMQQFIQFNHHPAAAAHTAAAAAALLSHPGLPPPHHGLARPSHDPSSLLKGQPLPPATMDALTRSGIWENCRAAYEDIVKHLERLREDHRNDPDRVLSLENKARDLSSHNGSSTGHSPVLNLSKNGGDHSGSEADHTPQEEAEDDVDSMSDNDDEEEKDHDLMDNSDVVRAASNSSAGASETASQNGGAINYSGSTNMNAASSVGPPSSAQDAAISSTETLLRNIQGLLKVAADNARQQERQISYEKAELKMDVLREREVKESLERQLSSEQKMRIVYEKRYKKERKTRKHFQDQLESEIKRRSQLEEAIKSSCNSADVLRVLSAVEYTTNERGGGSGERERDKEKDRERSVTEHSDSSSYSNSANSHQHNPNTEPSNDKPWNYSGIDLMNPGAIFWQNYSESLQELESERKSRHQQLQQQSQHVDGPDSKSPLQDSRAAASYYKNSVLFSTAT